MGVILAAALNGIVLILAIATANCIVLILGSSSDISGEGIEDNAIIDVIAVVT